MTLMRVLNVNQNSNAVGRKPKKLGGLLQESSDNYYE